MKKLAAALIVLIVAAAAAGYYVYKHREGGDVRGSSTEFTSRTGFPSQSESAESVFSPGPWHVTPDGSEISGAPSAASTAVANRSCGARRPVRTFPVVSSRMPQPRSP